MLTFQVFDYSENFIKWVDSNGLSLNLKKTHYIVFSNRRINLAKIDVKISGTNIQRVAEARFLGVIIDEKLTWSSHITAIKQKMNRYMGIMYKIKRFLPLQARLQLYHSFVQFHLNYSKTPIYRASRGKGKRPGKSGGTVNRGTEKFTKIQPTYGLK